MGCGGRGTQAIQNLLTGTDNVEIVAMADIFEDRLEDCLRKSKALKPALSDRVKVDPEHHFVGFDAYKKVIASVDIVMLATYPAYRPMHFEAAVEAKKAHLLRKAVRHRSGEPAPVHGGGEEVGRVEAHREIGRAAALAGLVSRPVQAREERRHRRHRGAQRQLGGHPVLNFKNDALFPDQKRDPKWGDMEFQHRNWYSFVWISGDQIVEQHLHNIDVCNWFMGTHPVEVMASGGAAWRPREEEYGNIYDHMHADFVYPNGVHMASHCRQYNNAPRQRERAHCRNQGPDR